MRHFNEIKENYCVKKFTSASIEASLKALQTEYIDIEKFSEIKPAVNQVETHVFQQQKVAKEYMKKYGCQIESWGPFAEGKNDIFNNPVLTKIGEKYNKTAAQAALRFLLQSDVVIIPKSTHKERMEQNFAISSHITILRR